MEKITVFIVLLSIAIINVTIIQGQADWTQTEVCAGENIFFYISSTMFLVSVDSETNILIIFKYMLMGYKIQHFQNF